MTEYDQHPIFPLGAWEGMTIKQYAAIQLRIPESGTPWLDDWIREANRRDMLQQAVQGFCTQMSSAYLIARSACEVTDAIQERAINKNNDG